MDDLKIFELRILIAVCAFFVISSSLVVYSNHVYDKACENIGFSSYTSVDGISACVDEQGNVYFVHTQGFWHPNATRINVGDMRVPNG